MQLIFITCLPLHFSNTTARNKCGERSCQLSLVTIPTRKLPKLANSPTTHW